MDTSDMVFTTKNTKITKGKHVLYFYPFVSFVPFVVMVATLKFSA